MGNYIQVRAAVALRRAFQTLPPLLAFCALP